MPPIRPMTLRSRGTDLMLLGLFWTEARRLAAEDLPAWAGWSTHPAATALRGLAEEIVVAQRDRNPRGDQRVPSELAHRWGRRLHQAAALLDGRYVAVPDRRGPVGLPHAERLALSGSVFETRRR